MPQQSQRDIDVAVGVAVGQLGQASGSQLQAQTRTVTNDLLRRLPRADRVYLEQMMYATYCSSLRDNTALTETERNARIQAYNRELRATLNPINPQPAPKVDPRDAARAELARVPVEYTPAAFIRNAADGKTAVIRLFLQAGIDPNVSDPDGLTALMRAAGRGDLPMMEMLLKAGATVNARTRRTGNTALGWAAGGGEVAAMRLLLKAGAARESFDDAFLEALRKGHVDAMRLLLDQGANPRADDAATAHMLSLVPSTKAAQLPEIVNILLQRGWPVDARTGESRTGNDQTVLMDAVFNGDMPLIELLLQAGADVNLQCDCRAILNGGHTALTLASYKGNEKVVQRLLDAGATVDTPSNGGTPLIVAADAGYTPVVKLLLSRGADVKARNSKGETALMHAALRHADMVKLLLAAGADVNAQDGNAATALMWATHGDQPAIARMLLDAGAQLEHKTERGRTALMLAAMRGNVDVARLLIQRGARVDVVDEDNRSITAHAAELKGDERARMLALLERKEPK
jgi:ankyrin repeat protein